MSVPSKKLLVIFNVFVKYLKCQRPSWRSGCPLRLFSRKKLESDFENESNLESDFENDCDLESDFTSQRILETPAGYDHNYNRAPLNT
jgi:hypothetical protein